MSGLYRPHLAKMRAMNPYLLNVVELGPRIIRRAVRAVPASEWDAPTGPDRFSVREVVAHLTDWEPILRGRMVQAVESPGTTIQPYDEGVRAEENAYHTQDVAANLDMWQTERAATATWLRGRSPEDWSKQVIHPERGTMSVSDLANMLLGHDLYHVEQLQAFTEQFRHAGA